MSGCFSAILAVIYFEVYGERRKTELWKCFPLWFAYNISNYTLDIIELIVSG